MIYDFRPSAEPEHHANARRAQGGLCYWNGAEMKDVAYADTSQGTLALLARNWEGRPYRESSGMVCLHWMRGGTVTVIEQPGELLETVRKPRVYDLDAECAVMG